MKPSNFLYHCLGACFRPYKLFFSLHTMFFFPLSEKPSGWYMYISSSKSP
ncbi:hypothetical protein LguiB_029018 [Lonicera macranthoides]